MSVSVSGAVLSALLYEQSNCNGDQEGFLLGQVVNHVTDTISDSQLNNRKEETVTYIYNYVPSTNPFSWYDHAGRVNSDKLKALLKGHKLQEVIGWYKWRRQSTLSPSLREKAIHRALMETFPGVHSQHFLFSLFSSSATTNLATHSFDHIFQYHNGRCFQRLPVKVVNLKDTSQADYKLQANHNINPAEGIYAETLHKARNEFCDPTSGRLYQVEGIHTLNCQLHQQLMELYDKVSTSEENVGSLTTEVEQLRERWKRKRYPPAPIQTDVNSLPRRQTASASPQPSRVDLPPLKTEGHRETRVTRQRSKQEEITEELKDLFLSPIVAQPQLAKAPSPVPQPVAAGDSPRVKLSSESKMPSGLLESKMGVDRGRAVSPALSSHSNQSGKSSEDLDLVLESLSGSPSAARKDRAARLSNSDEPSTPKNNASKVNAEKPQKKDAFDFVNNMLQDHKSNVGLRRNSPGGSSRQTRAQSMIVDKTTKGKQRSATPTRDPSTKTQDNARTAAGRAAEIRQKASTLPMNMGSPRMDESMDEDVPGELSSSPTF